MKYSFKYLVYNNRDYTKHDIYTKLFAFLFSIIPTWFILNFTKMSANLVTLVGLFFGILGAILGLLCGLEFLFYGFTIFLVLDFVDGNVAIAKGGGSYIGAILDMLSDRTTLFVSILALTNYHLNNSQNREVLLLLLYFLGFIFLDILALSVLSAKKTYKIESRNINSLEKEPNNFKKIISSPLIWLPGRISSYIFIIVTFFATNSFINAYIAGIFCIISAFFTTIIQSTQAKSKYGKSKG